MPRKSAALGQRRANNRILRALPAADFERLLPDLEMIAAPATHVFYRRGDRIKKVYFPSGGMASITAVLSDGTKIETATVGNEGMLGLEAFMGQRPVATGETMVQVADGSAAQLSVIALRRELARHGALHDILGLYAQYVVAQMMQSTACNALHQIPDRCCRWLLMTHDRVGQDEFGLSHRFLAMMLGVRRQSVTVVAGTLQAAGFLSYKHARMKILNRKGLERASCECYRRLRQFETTLRASD